MTECGCYFLIFNRVNCIKPLCAFVPLCLDALVPFPTLLLFHFVTSTNWRLLNSATEKTSGNPKSSIVRRKSFWSGKFSPLFNMWCSSLPNPSRHIEIYDWRFAMYDLRFWGIWLRCLQGYIGQCIPEASSGQAGLQCVKFSYQWTVISYQLSVNAILG